MLNDVDKARLAAEFGVYDHEWRFIACHSGEPHLVDRLLIFDDGTVLSLDAFALGDPHATVAADRIHAVLAELAGPHHRLVHVWGVFEPSSSLDLAGRRFLLANPDAAKLTFEGEYKVDLRDLTFADEPACRKTLRQIRNKGVEVTIAPSEALTAVQLRLIEIWRRGRGFSGLSISAGQAIATFVRAGHSYTATACVDRQVLGFSVFSRPNPSVAVNLMSFSERTPGSRVDDALQWASTQFARDLGCTDFSLGYAGYDGLAAFKRKWGGRQIGPAYRAAIYAADEQWAETGRSYGFAWNTRLHCGP